jgi:hypothetical protein
VGRCELRAQGVDTVAGLEMGHVDTEEVTGSNPVSPTSYMSSSLAAPDVVVAQVVGISW